MQPCQQSVPAVQTFKPLQVAAILCYMVLLVLLLQVSAQCLFSCLLVSCQQDNVHDPVFWLSVIEVGPARAVDHIHLNVQAVQSCSNLSHSDMLMSLSYAHVLTATMHCLLHVYTCIYSANSPMQTEKARATRMRSNAIGYISIDCGADLCCCHMTMCAMKQCVQRNLSSPVGKSCAS